MPDLVQLHTSKEALVTKLKKQKDMKMLHRHRQGIEYENNVFLSSLAAHSEKGFFPAESTDMERGEDNMPLDWQLNA